MAVVPDKKAFEGSVVDLVGKWPVPLNENPPRVEGVLPTTVEASGIFSIPFNVLLRHLSEPLGLDVRETVRLQ